MKDLAVAHHPEDLFSHSGSMPNTNKPVITYMEVADPNLPKTHSEATSPQVLLSDLPIDNDNFLRSQTEDPTALFALA